MGAILEQERHTYDEMWAVDLYGRLSPGERYADLFVEMTGARRGQTVLDAGCGAGRGALALRERGLIVSGCDVVDVRAPEIASMPFRLLALWRDVAAVCGRCEYVYCCDVLEHLPPTLTMLAVHQVLQAATKQVFLSIGLGIDSYGAWVGRPLHQTVQTFEAWRDQLAEIATVMECRDLHASGIYLLER